MLASITAQRHFNHTDLPIISDSASKIIDEHTIDTDAWLKSMAKRANQPALPKLNKACELLKTQDLSTPSKRSNAFLTGVGMADILAYLYQDEDALVSAMLYRTVRKDVLSEKQVRAEFGNEVADLVQETLKMGRLSDLIENNKRLEDHFNNNQKGRLAGIYNMLISVTNDVRVVLIKLAERTFAMRELSFATPERQQRVAREVMTIYAPLAHRLGIAQLKWELEDLSFRYLAPDRYKEIAKLLNEKRSERESYIQNVSDQLQQALAKNGIQGEISGRVKHIYSIYRKMKLKSLSFDQLYDIRALRVLVNSTAECYHVMGLVHGLWRHIPEQFDDYITNPKPNGYRSLHTAVIAENKSLEVQIRTFDMHYEAELGVCSHVNYKEGTKNKPDDYLTKKISSLRQILLNQDHTKDSNTKDNNFNPSSTKNETTKTPQHSDDETNLDFSEFERIYVFSKDGEIIELPKGSTVLDFAYYVHTQVGNRAQAARVNQRYVPLTYQPKTGEQVEIITKQSREPNRDWLVASLGYINTARARSKLRQWFNKQDRDKNIETGKHILNKALSRLSVHPNSIDLHDYVKFFNVRNADDILVGLVNGNVDLADLTTQITHHLDLEPDVVETELVPSIHPKATGKLDAYKIKVDGLDNIDIRLAGCCSPVQNEPIAGFITHLHGVSIHHMNCPEYERLIQKEPERAISAVWYGNKGKSQLVQIYLEAYDRRGLLRDLTFIIDQENANIRRVDTLSDVDDIARLNFTIEVTGLGQLSKLLAKLEQQHGIILARRVITNPPKNT
ncbi:RelA/SpoT family protein [Moraxella macacae]|nr:bifunctional (p)ppGpp synthetase/guanosine-3',5'-bis(diphosphate) 3'-pyrophosphohydrolase [Moraxella macacae]